MQKPLVLAHRADRTFTQIVELDREVSTAVQRRNARKLLDQGVPPESVAAQLALPIEIVRAIAKAAVDDARLSADARKWAEGEFFYALDRPGPDGFFLLAVPRRAGVKVVASAEGFVSATQHRRSGDGLFEDLGAVSLAPAAVGPPPPGR